MDDFDSRCQNCSKALEATRQMCAGCKVARYCNRSCQKKRWAIHKDHCRFMQLAETHLYCKDIIREALVQETLGAQLSGQRFNEDAL